MPRVNRDLQRRMAARRERERRRPTERGYRYGTPEGVPAADEGLTATDNGASSASTTVVTVRSITSQRPARRTYAEYQAEYRYVLGDLRRVALVVGSLLLILIVLYFLLPR